MTVGGIDTYYDYDQRQWMFRRLGGGPVRQVPVCPVVRDAPEAEAERPPVADPRVPAKVRAVRDQKC